MYILVKMANKKIQEAINAVLPKVHVIPFTEIENLKKLHNMLTSRIDEIDYVLDSLIENNINQSDPRWDAIYLKVDLVDNIKKINKEMNRLIKKNPDSIEISEFLNELKNSKLE